MHTISCINYSHKINLLDFDKTEIRNFFLNIGEKSFRADQIMNWIYHNLCNNFHKMNNISKNLQNKLKKISIIQTPTLKKEYISKDHTIKWILSVKNGVIETVYIPEKKRSTLCISSQIGCILDCKFCSTGQNGFIRNLSVSEIIGQIFLAYKKIKKMNNILYPKITNIVIMGMGEPLLNFNNVITSLKIMSDNLGFNISKKKIMDVKLAISLHATNNILRNQIMPINKKYNIQSLLNSIKEFLKISKLNKKGIIIEYVMLHNINDTLQHAQQLINILKNIPIKVNLIPWNYLPNTKFFCSKKKTIHAFYNFLNSKKIFTTIRKPRGQDIQAACGQLNGNI